MPGNYSACDVDGEGIAERLVVNMDPNPDIPDTAGRTSPLGSTNKPDLGNTTGWNIPAIRGLWSHVRPVKSGRFVETCTGSELRSEAGCTPVGCTAVTRSVVELKD